MLNKNFYFLVYLLEFYTFKVRLKINSLNYISVSNLFKTKSLDNILANTPEEGKTMKRTLGAFNLTTLGIGAIIGAGIFVITGSTAATYSGPAIVLSFILAGIACGFAGLCYAEFASMIPVSGSAYTYAYATMGEFIAWIIGWDLILEYIFAASTVAVGWSGYVVSFLKDFGIYINPELTAAWGTKLIHLPKEGWVELTDNLQKSLLASGQNLAAFEQTQGILNLPAVLAIGLLTMILYVGIQESAKFNNMMVVVKVIVILLFIGIGFAFVNSENWFPFIPENNGTFGEFGFSGVVKGAATIFFAYIGFDTVSTAAQEAKNPQRDMPIGILASLAICTILYILVALVLTGIVKYDQLNVSAPIALAVDSMGGGMKWFKYLIKIGAIAGLSSAMLVMLMGQPRIFYSMSMDGLLPKVFSHVHPKFKTPHVSTLITGFWAMLIAGLVPMKILGDLVSIGTLLAFIIVCVGVLVLRYTKPNLNRPFKTPFIWVVALGGVGSCLFQMVFLSKETWERLIYWMAIGLVIYFVYGMRNSFLNKKEKGL